MEVAQMFRQDGALQQFRSDVERARAEAVARGCRATVQISSDGKSYDIGFDYWPFTTASTIEEDYFHASFPEHIEVEVAAPIIFDSRAFYVSATGDPSSTTISLKYDSTTYCVATLYSTGYLSAIC